MTRPILSHRFCHARHPCGLVVRVADAGCSGSGRAASLRQPERQSAAWPTSAVPSPYAACANSRSCDPAPPVKPDRSSRRFQSSRSAQEPGHHRQGKRATIGKKYGRPQAIRRQPGHQRRPPGSKSSDKIKIPPSKSSTAARHVAWPAMAPAMAQHLRSTGDNWVNRQATASPNNFRAANSLKTDQVKVGKPQDSAHRRRCAHRGPDRPLDTPRFHPCAARSCAAEATRSNRFRRKHGLPWADSQVRA